MRCGEQGISVYIDYVDQRAEKTLRRQFTKKYSAKQPLQGQTHRMQPEQHNYHDRRIKWFQNHDSRQSSSKFIEDV